MFGIQESEWQSSGGETFGDSRTYNSRTGIVKWNWSQHKRHAQSPTGREESHSLKSCVYSQKPPEMEESCHCGRHFLIGKWHAAGYIYIQYVELATLESLYIGNNIHSTLIHNILPILYKRVISRCIILKCWTVAGCFILLYKKLENYHHKLKPNECRYNRPTHPSSPHIL